MNIHRLDCQVHILDAMQLERAETWVIGKDVTQDAYESCKDENGHLYAAVHYKDGEASTYVIKKSVWDSIKRDVFASPAPSSLEEHFEYHHKMLLSSGLEAQLVAAATINTCWHGFNLEYPDFESFLNADPADYLRKMSNMIKKMAADELMDKAPEGTSRGAALVHLYLTAVARNDATMVNRIADALEPFNKAGS